MFAIPQGTASPHVSNERPRLELEVPMPDLLARNLGNLGRGQYMAFPGTLLGVFWRTRGVLESTSEGPQRKVPIVESFLVVYQECCNQCVHSNEILGGFLSLRGIVCVVGYANWWQKSDIAARPKFKKQGRGNAHSAIPLEVPTQELTNPARHAGHHRLQPAALPIP